MSFKGIKKGKNDVFNFSLGHFDLEEQLMEVNIIKVDRGRSGGAQSYKVKVPMTKSGKILKLRDRDCVDLETKEFLNNCGVIEEDNRFALYAY